MGGGEQHREDGLARGAEPDREDLEAEAWLQDRASHAELALGADEGEPGDDPANRRGSPSAATSYLAGWAENAAARVRGAIGALQRAANRAWTGTSGAAGTGFLEARAEARGVNARPTPAPASRILERARGTASRPAADARRRYWDDLVSGRYSFVHCEDQDGRRFYVAVENPAASRSLRALTPREREIVGHAIAGVPHKVTAHELGITEPSVTRGLARALTKLGIPSRERLVDLAGRLGITHAGESPERSSHAA